MTEKKAKTATPHLRETPEQRQQIEHEDAIENAQEKMGNAWVLVSRNVWPPHTPPRTKDPLNSAFCLPAPCASRRTF
jgi:hypothetical protein